MKNFLLLLASFLSINLYSQSVLIPSVDVPAGCYPSPEGKFIYHNRSVKLTGLEHNNLYYIRRFDTFDNSPHLSYLNLLFPNGDLRYIGEDFQIVGFEQDEGYLYKYLGTSSTFFVDYNFEINNSDLIIGTSTNMPGIRIRKSGGNAVVANGIINVVNSATISGSTLVCGSSASFDLQNQPIGSSITWVIKQNGINKAQGSGTHASSLNLSNGSGNISYTINFNCGPNSPQVLSKDFWVGIPAVTISGPSEGYLGNSYTFYEYPVGNSYASSFNWTLTPEFSGNNIYNYGYWASAAFYGSSGYYQVSCIPTNLCGTGSMATSYIEIYETLGLTISPNPASSEVTVRIDQNIINQNENDLNELNFEVIIYNAFGVIQSRKEYSGLTFIIPVGYFNDGNYIIKFDNGKSVITKQLIIKH